MPAIVQKERDWLAEGNAPETAGQVNYLLTKLFHAYFTNYQSINDIAETVEYAIASLIKDGSYYADMGDSLGSDLEKIVMTADVPVSQIVGALRCCFTEFYRMKAADYEDKKYETNGPV